MRTKIISFLGRGLIATVAAAALATAGGAPAQANTWASGWGTNVYLDNTTILHTPGWTNVHAQPTFNLQWDQDLRVQDSDQARMALDLAANTAGAGKHKVVFYAWSTGTGVLAEGYMAKFDAIAKGRGCVTTNKVFSYLLAGRQTSGPYSVYNPTDIQREYTERDIATMQRFPNWQTYHYLRTSEYYCG